MTIVFFFHGTDISNNAVNHGDCVTRCQRSLHRLHLFLPLLLRAHFQEIENNDIENNEDDNQNFKVIPSAVKINFLFIIEEFSPFDKYFFVSLLLFFYITFVRLIFSLYSR